MVSAWANTNRLVLGQVKVEDKSNEITAIPELLAILDLNGCVVSIDAMGTQRDIAQVLGSQGLNKRRITSWLLKAIRNHCTKR
jgi:predicted transposase YbfD/YdcC